MVKLAKTYIRTDTDLVKFGAAWRTEMAAHLTVEDVERLPIIPYADIRDSLQSGDLFFASGHYSVSKAIECITHSPWSHVALVLRVDEIGRILLLESVEDAGVRLACISKYLDAYGDGKPYDGHIVLARLNISLDAQQIRSIALYGIDQLSTPYDKDELARILLRVMTNTRRRPVTNDRYICSELVHDCFRQIGIDLHDDKLGFISPESLWVDPRIQLLAKLL